MSAIRLFSAKYAILLKTEWAVMMTYRGNVFLWMLSALIQPMVSLAVWLSISDQGSVLDYRAKDYVLYFLGIVLIERLTRSWEIWELDESIREGTFSAKLLRPFHPIHVSIASNLVYRLFFAALLIPAWLFLAGLFPIFRLESAWVSYGVALMAILFSAVIRFMICYCAGILAFWTNRAVGIYMAYEAFHLLLSGNLAPLSMFPAWLAEIVKWLPFYATMGFPVDCLMGRFEGNEPALLAGLATQSFWMIGFFVLFAVEWKKGIRKYSAVGG